MREPEWRRFGRSGGPGRGLPRTTAGSRVPCELAHSEEDEEQDDGEDRHDRDHEPLDRSLHQFDAPFVYEPFAFPRTQTIGRTVWMHPTLGGQYCHLPCRFRMTNDCPTPPPYQQPM